MRVLLGLFNLAMGEADHANALALVETMHRVEGPHGTFWRFAQATLLIEQARRAQNKDRKLSRADAAMPNSKRWQLSLTSCDRIGGGATASRRDCRIRGTLR